MSTKSINIDPNILNMNGNKKSRRNNTTKKNLPDIQPIKWKVRPVSITCNPMLLSIW